jgi:organic radical activating enzyme
VNVLLTNHCNRRCPYCFAQERIAHTAAAGRRAAAPPFIAPADFRRVVAFATRSRLRSLGILGGEPSLHPRFAELVGAALDAGLEARVFTNGLWRPSQLEAVAKVAAGARGRLHVVLNVNEPALTPPRHRAAQERLLERLSRWASLSFNVYRAGCDPAFLVDLILRHRTRRNIRLGLAQPLAAQRSQHLEVGDYPLVAPAIVDLARRCSEHDVRLGFDCGFTLCMFTPEQLGELVLAGCRIKASCVPALDIGTDLSAWACFPLSALASEVKLTDFDDVEGLHDHFRKRYARLYAAGALPACVGCPQRRRRQCAGGCAAHAYRRLSA